jgi:hypothetical protein
MRNSILSLVIMIAFATTTPAFGQGGAGQIHLPPMVQQGPNTSNIPVRTQEEAERERVKKALEMLQMEIRRDTEKLAQLTAELKEAVDKSSQGLLPADTLKKAEQIEKLAHSVKSKIKQSY